MPTVSRFRGGRFVVNTNDHNPPHVHVILDDGENCRINLLSGEFMDSPPRGMERTIRRAYFESAEAIWNEWERLHPSDP